MTHLPALSPDYASPVRGPKKDPREEPNPDDVDVPQRDAPNVPKAPRRMPRYDPIGTTA